MATTLLDQFKSHIISQTITNKLNEIQNLIDSPNFNEQQKESAFSYQMLLNIILSTLNSKALPVIPKLILDNLNIAINNLSTNILCDINGYYSQYQNLIDCYNHLPHFEKKSDIKESFNTIISRFMKQEDSIKIKIENEIKNFKELQEKILNSWENEKSKLNQELDDYKQENANLKKEIASFKKNISMQEERLQNIISNHDRDYRSRIQTYDQAFISKNDEYKNIFDNMLNEKSELSNNTLNHLNQRKEEVEKLWGIIGKSATVGNASYHANQSGKFANIMMIITVILMCIGLTYIGIATWKLFNGQYQYIDFVWKVITSAIILVPALYCANISKRQRDREFLLRDFELKTAALEPFMESMILENGTATDNGLNKDQVKLELTKSFFDQQYGKNTNECLLLPKELTKVLNLLAKKCNLNINIGNKSE